MTVSLRLTALGEVCEFIRGITFKPADVTSKDSIDAVACFRTKNVQEELDLRDVLYLPSRFVTNPSQYVRAGDILISTANSKEMVGKCCFVEELPFAATLGGFIAAARPKPNKAHPRYLYFWMSSPSVQATFRRTSRQTTNIANLPLSQVEKIQLPVASLSEQQRIVRILDEADELRRLRAQADRRTANLIPAIFNEMFGEPATNPNGWQVRPLNELIHFGDKINYGVVQPGDDFPGGVPIVRVGDFDGMKISTSSLKTIDPSIEVSYKRSRLEGDEVLIACVGATIGKIALADPNLKGFNIVRAIARVRCGEHLNRLFLALYLKTPFVQSYFHQAIRTVAQPTLNIQQIEATPTLIPPIDFQQQFAARVAEVRALEESQAASRDRLNDLFQSLLHRAFTGEL